MDDGGRFPLRRTLTAWTLLAVAMTANGIFRETVLRPAFDARADVISAALGIGLILGVTAIALRPLPQAGLGRLAAISALFVALTVVFEVVIGRAVDHKTWAELAANYAFWKGRLWPIVLLVVALTPFVWGRARSRVQRPR